MSKKFQLGKHACFTPVAPLHVLLEQAAEDLAAYHRSMQAGCEAVWSTLAREQLPSMMRNSHATAIYLTAPVDAWRLVAASLVDEYWPADDIFAQPCLERAFEDPLASVRGGALSGLVYKLHPLVDDPSRTLTQVLGHLRRLESLVPGQLIREAGKMRRSSSRELEDYQLDKIRGLAGSHVDALLESPQAAQVHLDHEDLNVRYAALYALTIAWNIRSGLRTTCMQMCLADVDLHLRSVALDALCVPHHRSNDVEIGRFLARLVCDRSLPMSLRQQAYVELYLIPQIPLERLCTAISGEFRFPRDVDWQYVDGFLA